MRRDIPWWIAGTFLVLGGLAAWYLKDARNGTERPSPASAKVPPDRLAEVRLEGGAEFLETLRASLGASPARLLVPRNPAEALDRVFPLPPALASDMTPTSPLLAIALGEASEPSWVLATRTRQRGAELQNTADLVIVGQDGSVALGTTEEDVRRAAPYLARRMAEDVPPAGLHAIVLGHELLEEPRRWLLGRIEALRRGALRAAASERARHAAAPTYGDPEVLVAVLHGRASSMARTLTGVDRLASHVGFRGGSLSLAIDVTPVPESPLAGAIAETDAVGTGDIGALGGDTALAWTSAVPDPETVAAAVIRFAGDRMTDAERANVGAAVEEVLRSLGERFTVHMGADGSGSWLALSSGRAPREPDLDVIERAMGVGWVRTVLAAIGGCAQAATGAFEPRQGSASHRTHRLCVQDDSPASIHVIGGKGPLSLWLARGDASGPPETHARLEGTAEGETAIVAAHADPGALLAMATGRTPRMSKPIMLSAKRTGANLSAQITVPVPAFEPLMTLFTGGNADTPAWP